MNTATGRMSTAPAMTNGVTSTWMTAAPRRLTTRAGSTALGSSSAANAGRTAHPMSGPIHGMNAIRPAMTAMSGAYGIAEEDRGDAHDGAVDGPDEQPAPDEPAERDRDRLLELADVAVRAPRQEPPHPAEQRDLADRQADRDEHRGDERADEHDGVADRPARPHRPAGPRSP